MSEKSFRQLVSFKSNYASKSLTEKQIRDEFKSVFANDDESNSVFFDTCSLTDLQDLCMCFERYLTLFPNADFRDLGISKYVTENERFFLFTISETIKNIAQDEITGVNEEVVELFQIREIGADNRNVKGYIDTSVTNKLSRKEEGNHKGKIADKMLKKMINNEVNAIDNSSTMVCKSKLRVLMCNYNTISDLIRKTKQKEVGDSEEVDSFIKKLQEYQAKIQENLRVTVVDIETKYEAEDEYKFTLADKLVELEEEAKTVLGSNGEGEQDACSKSDGITISSIENAVYDERRRKIEILGRDF